MSQKKPWERDYGTAQPQTDPMRVAPNPTQVAEIERDRARDAAADHRDERRIALAEEKAARDAEADALKLREEREEAARLAAAQQGGMSDALYQLRNTISAARAAQRLAADGSGIGSYEGTEAFREGGPLGVYGMTGINQDALDVEALLTTVKSNTAFDRLQRMREESKTGGALGAVSAPELALLESSIAALNQTQSDEQFAANLQKVIDAYTRIAAKVDSADRYMRANGTMEGYTPPTDEEIAEFTFRDPEAQEINAAGGGAENTIIPVPDEMQAQFRDYINRNWGRLDANDLSRFMSGLEAKYNREVSVPDYSDFVGRANEAFQQGAGPEVVGPIPATNRDLSAGEQILNDVVTNPFGTGFTSFANSATLGIPAAMAGRERMQAIGDLNPVSAFAGDMVGGAAGTLLTGGALNMGAKAIGAGGRLNAAMTNPLTADVAYGTTFGALSDDDAISGALTGGVGAVVGDQIGRLAGRGFGALRSPDDVLTSGQRVVLDNVEDVDEVAAALTRANELGVPMTLADASPRLTALGGAAIPHSGQLAQDVGDMLYRRNAGQYDRLADAVERDLGPVINVEQQADDLIQQAREAAAPLYDEAYAAEGADMVDLAGLADRPTFGKALREAYTEILDEGGDPSAMGLQVAGDDILIASPSWQALDYTKRGLDNIIERGIRQGDMPEVRRAQAMKQALVSQMDTLNPAYGRARQAYAGPAGERNLLQEGVAARRQRPNALGVQVSDYSPEQMGNVRLGYQSELLDNAGGLRNNSNPWAQLNTRNAEGQMGALYDEDADVARLLEQRDLELRLAGNSNRLTGGSQTQPRQVADAYFSSAADQAGLDVGQASLETLALGAPVATIGQRLSGRFFADRARDAAVRKNEALADEIGPLLFAENSPAQVDELLRLAQEDRAYQEIVEGILDTSVNVGRRLGTGASAAAANTWVY